MWAENGYKERATPYTQNGTTDKTLLSKRYITNTLNGQHWAPDVQTPHN